MIASLTGLLKRKTPQTIILDVQGVGYEVTICLPTFHQLPSLNEKVHLFIHTHVREDAFHLYGFSSGEEKELFLLVTGISGVGPKLAINILSGLSLADFVEAVRTGNVALLHSIPGVGQKTAARLALELKGKITSLVGAIPGTGAKMEGLSSVGAEDAVSALVHLGYKAPRAKDAVEKVMTLGNKDDDFEAMPVEALIKESLKVLSRT